MASQHELLIALEALATKDTTLRHAVKKYGVPMSRRLRPGFATLSKIVVDQQISTKAAAAIWRKLKTNVGQVTALNISSADEILLKESGLSASKAKTLRAMAAAALDNSLNFRSLGQKSDQEVLEALTAIWGIGPWTAEIYLMFGMGRTDVWPAGDLALRIGWQIVSGHSERLSAEDLKDQAELWRPHRSAAATLLWHAVGVSRNKIALAKPT